MITIKSAYLHFPALFQVKIINGAGLVTNSSSPGIRLDPTPPKPVEIVAVDPEFHMTLPATHQGHLDSLAAWWEFEELESEIVGYQVRKIGPIKLTNRLS